MENSVPTEEKIDWAVQRLQNNHSEGPSGMREEHLKGWMEESRKAEEEKAAEEAADATGGTEEEGMEEERDTGTEKDLTKWKKVVYLVRASFG